MAAVTTAKPTIAGTGAAAAAERTIPDARREQLRGKKVLFVCCGLGGLDSKRFVFEMSKERGVRCFLVEDPTSVLATEMETDKVVERFIRVSLIPRKSLLEDVIAAVKPIHDEVGHFDACLTFWDDSVTLTARICAQLSLPGHAISAVDIAHDKHLTRVKMGELGLPLPRNFLITNKSDLAKAKKIVGVPAILKPMYGGSSLGVIKIEKEEQWDSFYDHNIAELKKYYLDGELMGLTFDTDEVELADPRQLSKDYGRARTEDPATPSSTASTTADEGSPSSAAAAAAPSQIVFEGSRRSWMVAEEFLEGPEVDVDLLLHHGEVAYSCVVDDWPQLQPWFAELGNNCPSALSPEKQKAAKEMAIQCATEVMGFKDGVLHCELKVTQEGPRLIEINPRMGGGPVYALHRRAFGVDFVEEQLYSSLQIGNPPTERPLKECYSCSEKFFEYSMEIPAEFLQTIEAIRNLPNVVEATALVVTGEHVVGSKTGFPTRSARFLVCADSAVEAEHYAATLLALCDSPVVCRLQRREREAGAGAAGKKK